MNKLTLNPKKTVAMKFGTKGILNRALIPRLTIDNTVITMSKDFKYLGVVLDERLSFAQHICLMIRNGAYRTNLFARIRKFMTTKQSILIYKGKVLPFLEQGDVIIDGANVDLLNKLQTIQNRGLSIALHSPQRTRTSVKHKLAKLNYLHQRRKAHILCQAHRKFSLGIDLIEAPRALRLFDGPVLKQVMNVNKAYTRSMSYKTAMLWNDLHSDERNIVDAEAFKRKQVSKLALLRKLYV